MQVIDNVATTVDSPVAVSTESVESSVVSFQTELPQPLQQAMVGFI